MYSIDVNSYSVSLTIPPDSSMIERPLADTDVILSETVAGNSHAPVIIMRHSLGRIPKYLV